MSRVRRPFRLLMLRVFQCSLLDNSRNYELRIYFTHSFIDNLYSVYIQRKMPLFYLNRNIFIV